MGRLSIGEHAVGLNVVLADRCDPAVEFDIDPHRGQTAVDFVLLQGVQGPFADVGCGRHERDASNLSGSAVRP